MKATTQYVEAYGVKGMKSAPWCKTFKNTEALNAWVEKNGAEVHGIREIPSNEVTFR